MATPSWLRDSLLVMAYNNRIYAAYEKLYNGTVEESIASAKMRQDLTDTDYFRLNLCRIVVDAPLERTAISGIVASDPKARSVLEDFWTSNELDFESKVAHERAYEFGNSVVLCLPDEEGNIAAYVHSPRDVAVFYNPVKPREKSHAVHTYTQFGKGDESNYRDDQMYFVAVVYGKDVIQRYVSDGPIADNRVDYETIEMHLAEEIDSPVPGTIPAFHLRTARTPIGRSRLADATGPQLMINDMVTAMMASIKRAGFRQRYLLTELGEAGGDNFSEDNTNSGEGDIETNKYQAGPDTLFHFAGNQVRTGTFDVSESSNFTEPIDKTIRWMSKITDVPTAAFDTGATPPSGEALRRSEQSLNDVVENCQALFGATWNEMLNYVLALAGVGGEAEVAWDQPVTEDQDFWQTQEIKVSLGFPRAVAFVEAGYDPDNVKKWLPDTPRVIEAPEPEEEAEEDSDLIPPGTEREEF